MRLSRCRGLTRIFWPFRPLRRFRLAVATGRFADLALCGLALWPARDLPARLSRLSPPWSARVSACRHPGRAEFRDGRFGRFCASRCHLSPPWCLGAAGCRQRGFLRAYPRGRGQSGGVSGFFPAHFAPGPRASGCRMAPAPQVRPKALPETCRVAAGRRVAGFAVLSPAAPRDWPEVLPLRLRSPIRARPARNSAPLNRTFASRAALALRPRLLPRPAPSSPPRCAPLTRDQSLPPGPLPPPRLTSPAPHLPFRRTPPVPLSPNAHLTTYRLVGM